MTPANDVYVIDTSSVIQLRVIIPGPDRRHVMSRLDDLVTGNALVFPKQVAAELKRYQNPTSENSGYAWAKKHETHATRHKIPMTGVREVLARVPKILDPDKSGVEEADPYVLALAEQLKKDHENVIVITEERKDRLDKMSMTTACGLLRLLCLPLEAFLSQQGIWQRTR